MLQALKAANGLSCAAVIDFIKVINMIVGSAHQLPESEHAFKKVFDASKHYINKGMCLLLPGQKVRSETIYLAFSKFDPLDKYTPLASFLIIPSRPYSFLLEVL